MQIESLQITNLRCLSAAELRFNSLTTLIGGNNVGKSTILRAIELFFDPSPKIGDEDYCVHQPDGPIEITIGFHKLTLGEREEFGSAVVDGKLLVTRHFSKTDSDSGQYSARAMVYPEFGPIRAENNGTRKRAAYNTVSRHLTELPAIESFTEIDGHLAAWEAAHRDQCTPERVRAFFGATNVANGKLRKKTAVHLVPAVRDAAAESGDPRRSPIIGLLSDIAKQTFENRRETADFLERIKVEFQKISDPDRVPELAAINELLTSSVQRFYPDSKLGARWEQNEGVNLTFPTPRLEIEHNGLPSDLGRVGHGLQRAALFAIVQFLAERRASADREVGGEFAEPASDIILLIEEPEIYQHPSKQLVIFDAFKQIAESFNRQSGIRLQLIYTTHSEKFIRMNDFEIARIVRRVPNGETTKTVISGISLDECRSKLATLLIPAQDPMPREAFASKLHIFTREVCEAFFADRVILVEGATDKAILQGAYRARGRNINQESLCIVSVDGKRKLDKPALIFRALGIPTFVMFDNDAAQVENKQRRSTNILLQKICGEETPEALRAGVFSQYAAISNNLEDYIRSRIGNRYDELFQTIGEEFSMDFDDIKKTPAVLEILFKEALLEGFSFPLLDEIIAAVDAL